MTILTAPPCKSWSPRRSASRQGQAPPGRETMGQLARAAGIAPADNDAVTVSSPDLVYLARWPANYPAQHREVVGHRGKHDDGTSGRPVWHRDVVGVSEPAPTSSSAPPEPVCRRSSPARSGRLARSHHRSPQIRRRPWKRPQPGRASRRASCARNARWRRPSSSR